MSRATNQAIITELRSGSSLRRNQELLDGCIQRACYGADLSDIAVDLLKHGLSALELPNYMRLIEWEKDRAEAQAQAS